MTTFIPPGTPVFGMGPPTRSFGAHPREEPEPFPISHSMAPRWEPFMILRNPAHRPATAITWSCANNSGVMEARAKDPLPPAGGRIQMALLPEALLQPRAL